MTPKQERTLERIERMVRDMQSTTAARAADHKCSLANEAELRRADALIGQLRERAEAAERIVVLLTDSMSRSARCWPVRPAAWTDQNEKAIQDIWDRAVARERAPKSP